MRTQRTVGGEQHPEGLRLCSNGQNPLVTWSVALQSCTRYAPTGSNWLQLVIEDTKTGKTNLFVEVGLVASSWGDSEWKGAQRRLLGRGGLTLCLDLVH